jgi:tetratricopeptide (TPR) repeat protein
MGGLDPALAARIGTVLGEIRAAPDAPELRVQLGMVYAANALPRSAREALEPVAGRVGGPRAWYHLARAAAELGDMEAALRALERVAREAPRYVPAHVQAGFWLLDAQRDDEARAAFERALEIEPAHRGALLGLARVHLRRGENAAAAGLIEGLSGAATDPYGRYLLGLAYRDQGRLEEAGPLLRARLPGPPSWPDLWRDELDAYREGYRARLEAAEARAAAGDYQGAVSILDGLRRQRGATVDVHANLGMCYLALGRAAEAIAVLREGLDLSPDSERVHHMLAGAYWTSMDRADPAEQARLRELVLHHVERALRTNPSFVPSLALYGDALEEMERYEEALRAFRAAELRDQQNPDWPSRAAMLAARLGRLDEAEAIVAAARERIGPDQRLADAVAQIRRMRGQR